MVDPHRVKAERSAWLYQIVNQFAPSDPRFYTNLELDQLLEARVDRQFESFLQEPRAPGDDASTKPSSVADRTGFDRKPAPGTGPPVQPPQHTTRRREDEQKETAYVGQLHTTCLGGASPVRKVPMGREIAHTVIAPVATLVGDVARLMVHSILRTAVFSAATGEATLQSSDHRDQGGVNDAGNGGKQHPVIMLQDNKENETEGALCGVSHDADDTKQVVSTNSVGSGHSDGRIVGQGASSEEEERDPAWEAYQTNRRLRVRERTGGQHNHGPGKWGTARKQLSRLRSQQSRGTGIAPVAIPSYRGASYAYDSDEEEDKRTSVAERTSASSRHTNTQSRPSRQASKQSTVRRASTTRRVSAASAAVPGIDSPEDYCPSAQAGVRKMDRMVEEYKAKQDQLKAMEDIDDGPLTAPSRPHGLNPHRQVEFRITTNVPQALQPPPRDPVAEKADQGARKSEIVAAKPTRPPAPPRQPRSTRALERRTQRRQGRPASGLAGSSRQRGGGNQREVTARLATDRQAGLNSKVSTSPIRHKQRSKHSKLGETMQVVASTEQQGVGALRPRGSRRTEPHMAREPRNHEPRQAQHSVSRPLLGTDAEYWANEKKMLDDKERRVNRLVPQLFITKLFHEYLVTSTDGGSNNIPTWCDRKAL